MNTLPAPEFDDTRLWPILGWLAREFLRDLRELLSVLP
jgi:hypothetical protein